MLSFILAHHNADTLFTLDQKLIKLCEANGVACVYGSGVKMDEPAPLSAVLTDAEHWL
jgi:hypothetical protein